MNKGKLYIISAPSGAGKTSLVKRLILDLDLLTASISHTTRDIRAGETQGKDYFFVTIAEFKKMLAEQVFLEHAKVFDHYYGTVKQSVEHSLNKGIDVILEIDWQGARQVRTMLPDCRSIFILPPSIEILQHRLEKRGRDSKEIIACRMRDAIKEMSYFNEFDYLVINNDFNQALSEISSIIISHRLEKQRQIGLLSSLLGTLTIPD